MNEKNLSRRLSASIVEALKAQGHILVVKGGATALARELEEIMAPALALVLPRLEPRPIVGGEVTSTFGDESIDETVEEMVAELSNMLMDSDHVEDIFAEDNVIRRDIFRTVRDGLLPPAAGRSAGAPVDVEDDEDDEEGTSIHVRLDTLGYIAATVAKRTDPKVLRESFQRAGAMVHAHFIEYDADTRDATFTLEADDPDARLELEEAVADELAELVDEGIVDLPTIERRIDLGRPVTQAEQRAMRPRLDAAGHKTLLSTGCAATWDFTDETTLRVTFTPLSDHDALDVDQHALVFAREVRAIFASPDGATEAGRPTLPQAAPVREKPARPASSAARARADAERDGEEPFEEAEEPSAPSQPTKAKAAAKKPASATAPSKKTAAKKTAAKSATAKKTAKAPAATGSSPEPKTATKKPSKAATPSEKVRAAPAKKR